MVYPQKEPLRGLSEQEERELQRTARATGERVDRVRRAKALLAVAAGQPWTLATHEAGLKSGDGVGKLVRRRFCTWSSRPLNRRRSRTQTDLHE